MLRFKLSTSSFEGNREFQAIDFQFWRKSPRKASFLSYQLPVLKDVSQKSFVFKLSISIFEGSLADES